jgi:hypothetical protein
LLPLCFQLLATSGQVTAQTGSEEKACSSPRREHPPASRSGFRGRLPAGRPWQSGGRRKITILFGGQVLYPKISCRD